MDQPSLTVIFPCLNEADGIEGLAASARDFLAASGIDFEILIIDDGSTDGTTARASALSQADPRIQVITHQKNRGYGGALKSGFAAATKDLVFFTDGDGQFDIRELPLLLALIADHDIVTGYRINRRDGILRSLYALAWGSLVNATLNIRVRDVNCAFKLYRRRALAALTLRSDGAFINAEIFARARRAGYTIASVGVHHFPRRSGTQTGARPATILSALRDLWHLRNELA